MNHPVTLCRVWLATLIVVLFNVTPASAEDCAGFGDYGYICGPNSAEDLVSVPGTQWVIASGFGGGAPFYLLNAEAKTWSALLPGVPKRKEPTQFGACPAALDTENFVAHGLHVRARDAGRSTLYAVGHGAREAIEVFEVDARDGTPRLTWAGCVLTPDGMEANSVTSAPDGSLIATIPLHHGFSIDEVFSEQATGAAYRWNPGEPTFRKIEGTEMGYANGVELSADGNTIFIASSSHRKVFAFSNTDPAKLLAKTSRLAFIPDNLHMGRNGQLLTAGLLANDRDCGDVNGESFDLAAFASCHRAFQVMSIDAETLATTLRASSTAQPDFSNVTMALEVMNELWIGTFAGDRIAYLKQPGSGH